MKLLKIKIISIVIILLPLFSIASSDSCLEMWEKFSHTDKKSDLTGWLKNTAVNILTKNKAAAYPDIKLPAQPHCTGLFITLIKKGKVRGCYGAFTHRYNSPSDILKDYIKGALYLDPRHTPLEKYELEETDIVLTVTSNPEPVDDINNVDISNFGLLIECEDSSKTVIVPAEYKTSSKVLKLTGNGQCRIQKFRAVTIR
jgi:AMMECR1 domain-containing protein